MARRTVGAIAVLSVLLMTMGTRKAFEHYVNEALRKKARSKVIDRSKGARRLWPTSVEKMRHYCAIHA